MTRRLGLAQALINDPEFLILDEPTSGLDPVGTKQVKDLLIELGRRGKTILLSSHLLDEVEDVCDRMVVLYGGKIRAGGTADELLTDTSRTVLTTTRLSPDTIARIDRLLQEMEGTGVDKVDSPREKLEDFFMQLVEQARREQVATSGAQHGGKTAGFLVEREPADAGELIADLTREEQRPTRAVEARPAAAAASAAKRDVLAELVEERPAPSSPAPARPVERVEPPKDVDRSVIDDLLGGGRKGNGGDADGGRDGRGGNPR
jgi:ABC-2 type transport system ATP-binding protein